MAQPFQFWVLDQKGRMVTMYHDDLAAETYVRRKAEQLVYFLVKDMRTGHVFKYNPSNAGFELLSKRPKL